MHDVPNERIMQNNPIKAIVVCFLAVFTSGCLGSGNATNAVATPTLSDPHHHVVDVNQTELDLQNITSFEIIEVSVDSNLETENITVSQGRTYRAFTICDPTWCQDENCCQERILIENLQTGRIYEIQGLPLPWRPFSDLVWATDDILIFDRWSQPHYGIHYAVDIRHRELILASPFPDQLPSSPEK
jgi:hypothetical protein